MMAGSMEMMTTSEETVDIDVTRRTAREQAN
jgi:hypothetical protein